MVSSIIRFYSALLHQVIIFNLRWGGGLCTCSCLGYPFHLPSHLIWEDFSLVKPWSQIRCSPTASSLQGLADLRSEFRWAQLSASVMFDWRALCEDGSIFSIIPIRSSGSVDLNLGGIKSLSRFYLINFNWWSMPSHSSPWQYYEMPCGETKMSEYIQWQGIRDKTPVALFLCLGPLSRPL